MFFSITTIIILFGKQCQNAVDRTCIKFHLGHNVTCSPSQSVCLLDCMLLHYSTTTIDTFPPHQADWKPGRYRSRPVDTTAVSFSTAMLRNQD